MNTPTILFYTSVSSLVLATAVLGVYYFTNRLSMSAFTSVFGLLLALGFATGFASYYLTQMKTPAGYIDDARRSVSGYPIPAPVRAQDSVNMNDYSVGHYPGLVPVGNPALFSTTSFNVSDDPCSSCRCPRGWYLGSDIFGNCYCTDGNQRQGCQ